MLSIFSRVYWPSVCLHWRNVYFWILWPFLIGLVSLFLILSYMSYLYILEMNSFSVTSFADIFSHSTACLFILFTVSFAVQELACLVRSHSFIFALISIALGDWPKKTLLWFISENVLPMFSSKSFIVSLKSLGHFKLILYMVWVCVLTLLIYVELSSLPNSICWRDFLIVYSCLLCPRLIYCSYVGLFLDYVPWSHMSVFAPIPCCFDYCSFCSIGWRLGLTPIFYFWKNTLYSVTPVGYFIFGLYKKSNSSSFVIWAFFFFLNILFLFYLPKDIMFWWRVVF